MNWKRIFCRHEWVQTGMRHTFDSYKGYILKTYYQMKCEKCGKTFETEHRDFKFKRAEKQTSNLDEWRIKKILDGSFFE